MIDNERVITVAKILIDKNFAPNLTEIALKCGRSKQYFSDLKRKKSYPSMRFIDDLCSFYPVNKDYILTGNGEILLSENGSNMAGDVNANNSGSGVQNVQTNCGHVENNTHTGGGTGGEVLQQLIATNAKMVETLAQMVENNNKLMETNSRLMENNSKLMEMLSDKTEQ